MNRRLMPPALLALAIAGGCGGESETSGTFVLPADEAQRYDTAYIAEVVADPPGDDLAPGAGEYVLIRNNATIRIDMGGWWIEANGVRLPLGIGRQIDAGAELRVHTGPGETDEDDVFIGAESEILANDSGEVLLRDSGGSKVAVFSYGVT